MDSLQQRVKETATEVAVERALPWHFEDIWNGALRGQRDAHAQKSKAEQMGLEFQGFAERCMVVGAWKAADEIGPASAPLEERIRNALSRFCADEWVRIIGKLGRKDREVLGEFILANLAELEETMDLYKLQSIREAIGLQAARAVLRGARGWVRVTDAHYALVLHENARYHKLKLDPAPSWVWSWDEEAGPSAIARKLGISRCRAENMLKYMQEVSLEEFVAEHGGTFVDYWMWATDPRAYKRYRKTSHD